MREFNVTQDDTNTLNMLKRIKRFSQIPEEDLQAFIAAGKFREYGVKEVIIKEGNIDSWVYFLLSGSIRIIKGGRVVGYLKRLGDIFGEMDALGGSSRSTSVVAEAKSLILAIDTSIVEEQLRQDKTYFCYLIYRIFAEVLAVRLRQMFEENFKLKTERPPAKAVPAPAKPVVPQGKSPSPPQQKKKSESLHEKKILLVDHVEPTRKILRTILVQDLKCGAVIETTNGKNALTILQEETIDLIISELDLPKMSGTELLSSIKRSERLKDIPFILLMSDSNTVQINATLQSQISQCLLKPFTANTVIEKIKEAFRKS